MDRFLVNNITVIHKKTVKGFNVAMRIGGVKCA